MPACFSSFTLMIAAVFLIGGIACYPLPKKRLRQANVEARTEFEDGSLLFVAENPLHCPIRLGASSRDTLVQGIIKRHFPMAIPALSDTTLVIPLPDVYEEKPEISLSMTLGVPDEADKPPLLMAPPFPKGRKYRVLQGYNGSFSHQKPYSRYAVDFNLSIGDTVCAAADGYVVGVIDGYKHGGDSRKWRPFANFITLYHPDANIFTQYVHLVHKGSLVNRGDFVQKGSPIGLSGETGFTGSPHLHFNVLEPVEGGIQSVPFTLASGTKGAKLTRGVVLNHKK